MLLHQSPLVIGTVVKISPTNIFAVSSTNDQFVIVPATGATPPVVGLKLPTLTGSPDEGR